MGPLDDEQKSQDLAVLVSMWQTKEDIDCGPDTTVIARALGMGKHAKDSNEQTWSAEMFMRGGEFVAGHRATGVGLIVASNDDPTSFETYSWIRRLQIEVAPSPKSAFTP